jgi:hypothetical protein
MKGFLSWFNKAFYNEKHADAGSIPMHFMLVRGSL